MAGDHFDVHPDGRPFTSDDYSHRHAEVFAARYDDGLGDHKIRTIFDLAGPLQGRTVVDVACGVGNFTHEASRRGAARVVALDFAESMTTASRRRYPTLPVVRGSGTSLPLASDFADVAFALDVIEHVYEPEHMVRELRRVLRPGGVVIVSTDRDGIKLGLLGEHLRARVPGLDRIVRRNDPEWDQQRHGTPLCTHTHEYGHRELVALFEAGGFRLGGVDSYRHRARLGRWGQVVEAAARGPLKRFKWEFVACRFVMR